MSQQVIITTPANSGLGDSPNSAFNKCNSNFAELYTGSGVYYPQTAAEIAAGVTPVNFAYVSGNVLRNGADLSGGADSLAAFNSAAASNSDYVFIPSGTYKLSASPNAGLWQVAAGVSFTGSGSLSGQILERHGTSSNYTLRIVTNAQTVGQLIPIDFECGFYQTASPNASDQFGQTTECWTPSASAVVWNGELTGVYGSFSHFGSGDVNELYGASFEGFNSGSALATLVAGVSATANNGGVAAGSPSQTPANSGSSTNLRAFTGAVTNSTRGTVANAVMFYGNSISNVGGGAITATYGLLLQDQTAGVTNWAINTGKGIVRLGDAVEIAGNTNLPAATPAQFWLGGPTGGISNGRIYCGDGSGYRIEFAARTSSADTVVGYLTDSGGLSVSGGLGVHGATPATQSTGWGTPTGASVENNFSGSAATLAQTSAAVAQLITVLKAAGIIGS